MELNGKLSVEEIKKLISYISKHVQNSTRELLQLIKKKKETFHKVAVYKINVQNSVALLSINVYK